MSDITTSAPASGSVGPALRRLYFVRFAIAIVWAIALFATATHASPLLTVLLIVYPLVDAVSVIVQIRSEGPKQSPRVAEGINVALSVLAAIGLGIASSFSISAALVVWGIWAIVAGILQLVTAVLRLRTGGQVPLIVSGAISVLAGFGFLFQGIGGASSATGPAGYAVLGGIFFLISAIRLSIILRRAA
jgi:uncharacterized membrane protein HdeD (DUF308 family)